MTQASDQTWDPVMLVSNYYDYPLEGLVQFNGAPHLFVLADDRFIPSPDDPDDVDVELHYLLYAVPQTFVDILMSTHDMFERWHVALCSAAKDRKDDVRKLHPALPEDRANHAAAKEQVAIQKKEILSRPADTRQIADFRRGVFPSSPGHSDWRTFGVRWLGDSVL